MPVQDTSIDSNSEMGILRRVIDSERGAFSPALAQELLRLNFGPSDVKRMDELAAKNREGKLSHVEGEELQNYIRVGQTLGILQSKASGSLPADELPKVKKRRKP